MTLPRLTILALGASLASCTLGPNYRTPPLPSDAVGDFASASAAPVADAEPSDAWWRLYDDPLLDGLIADAFANNSDLRVAESNLLAASAQVTAARADLLPSTHVDTGASYGRTPLGDALSEAFSAKAPNGWLDNLGISTNYALDVFGEIRRGIEASQADAEAAAAARDVVRVTVAATVSAAYSDICALGRSSSVAETSADQARRALDATRKRAAAGIDTRFDVVRAEALVAQTEAAIAPLDAQRRIDLYVLAELLGRPPVRAPQEVLACRQPLKLATPLPIGDGTGLLRRRPDVRVAERNLAAASARIGVATASLYPRISLGGTVSAAADSIDGLGRHNSVSFGVGPLISWTFPNTVFARARLAQARAADAAALARFDGTIVRALSETEQALTVYGAELERCARLQAARTSSVDAYHLASNRFRDGASTYLDLLSAEQTAINSDAALAASERQVAADQIALFRALGGGWKTVTPPPP